MQVETEILFYGETAVWIECDQCGRAYGGPGVMSAIAATVQGNICVECLRNNRSGEAEKQMGNSC